MSEKQPARNEGIGRGEDGALRHQRGLRQQATGGRGSSWTRSWENVLEAKLGDAFDCRRGRWLAPVAVSLANAGLEGAQDAVLGIVAYGDDEGKPVSGHILGIEALEGGPFSSVGTPARRWLFRRAFGGQPFAEPAAGQIRVRPSERQPLFGTAERKMRASALCNRWRDRRQPSPAPGARSAIQGECSSDPNRATKVRGASGLGGRTVLGGWAFRQCSAMSMRRKPDTAVRLCIVETLQRESARVEADQPVVQPDREHLGAAIHRLRHKACRSCPSDTGRTARR